MNADNITTQFEVRYSMGRSAPFAIWGVYPTQDEADKELLYVSKSQTVKLVNVVKVTHETVSSYSRPE